jgi:tetratricopeptide (TPR) repeat protein
MDNLAVFSMVIAVTQTTVAIIAVLFVFLAVFEYARVRRLRRELEAFREKWKLETQSMLKAQQLVITSYRIDDPARRIALLERAKGIDPASFNVLASLGYARFDAGDRVGALEEWLSASKLFPDDPAVWCDLAWGYVSLDQPRKAKQALRKAVALDPAVADDIAADSRFSGVAPS